MLSGRRRWVLGMGLAVIAATGVGSSGQLLRVDASGATPSIGPNPESTTSAASGVTFSLVTPGSAIRPSVSGTGERVVFTAPPAEPVEGRTSSVWLQDRGTGELTELSLPNPNVRVGDSVDPAISADGCIVVMTTEMSYDLFRDDNRGNRWDVYRTTLPACGGTPNEWTLVSTELGPDGLAEARGDVVTGQPATMSGSGTVVAYVRPMAPISEVLPGTVLPNQVEVVDFGVPVDDALHSVAAPGLPTDLADAPVSYAGETSPALSGDGNIVVFTSDAVSQLAVPEWRVPRADSVVPTTQVYAWDRSERDPFTAVTLISATAADPTELTGATAEVTTPNASAVSPVVSLDGRVIAFASTASNLVPSDELTACAATCPSQVYVVDRDSDSNQVFDEAGTSTISIVSAVHTDTNTDDADEADTDDTDDEGSFVIGNAASFSPTMSSDGNTVVFASQATNLLQLETPGGGELDDGDIISADLPTLRLRRVFDLPSPTPGAYAHPVLSANSRVLVADTIAGGQLLGDPELTGRRLVAATFVPAVSMADLDLGTVLVKVPGPEWFVNVVNNGPGAFRPTAISSSNPEYEITGGSCRDLAAVLAGQTCSLTVVLTPSVSGPSASTLTVAEEGFGAITLTAHLTGAGGEPALLATPTAAAFGATVVGEPNAETRTFDIFNIYISPLAVTSVEIDGADAADFDVDASACLAATAVVSTPVPVVTAPPATAAPATAPPATPAADPVVPADPAAGVDPTAETTPPEVPTETTAPVTTAPTTVVVPATVTPATVLSTSTPVLMVDEIVPGVAPGTSCPVLVNFTPSAAGSRTASVNIGTAADQYTSMLVSGEGVYTPSLVAPPTAIPGRDLIIGGTGYPANTAVVIGWSDGSGRTMDVTTDAYGKFVITYPVMPNQRPGATTLVAQVSNGPSATIAVEVERVHRRTPGVPGLFG